MARNHVTIDASPEVVFDVLTDPHAYPRWVVGAQRIRAIDADWPEVGSRFHHTVGAAAATLDDSTKVVEIDPGKRLVLDARARPVGRALVELHLGPTGAGTHVTMLERLIETPGATVVGRLLDPLIHLRNVESLRRLRRVAEQRASQSSGATLSD